MIPVNGRFCRNRNRNSGKQKIPEFGRNRNRNRNSGPVKPEPDCYFKNPVPVNRTGFFKYKSGTKPEL